ncbi:hypothetical protein PM082_008996 [Marasmius tenuissimus]|nr:hypothetical protein PM082_008996 [Marasmius tenuissimus]
MNMEEDDPNECVPTDVKYVKNQPYQSRQMTRDIDMKLDKGFHIGDIFYREQYGWVFMGENEGDCRWRKFRRGEDRRILCPMDTGGHPRRVLNTHKFTWVVEKDYLHNLKRGSLKPKGSKKRTQARATQKTYARAIGSWREGALKYFTYREDEAVGVYDEDVDIEYKSDEDSGSRSQRISQLHAKHKVEPRQSIQQQQRELEPPHDEGQRSSTRILRSQSRTTNGKRKSSPERAEYNNDGIERHGSLRKRQKGAPPQVKDLASSTAIDRRGLSFRLRSGRHIVASEEGEGQAATSDLQQELSQSRAASGGHNTWIAEVLSDIDTNHCHPSLSESLHRWSQSKETLPTRVKICDNLQASVDFSMALLPRDLLECYKNGLTVSIVDSMDGPLHLKDPADFILDLMHVAMFNNPETFPPLAMAALSIPQTNNGLGKLELKFSAAYLVHGEEKPKVVHNPSANTTSYTPKGYFSYPRVNPVDMVVYHCHGQCLWLVYPHTLQNIVTMMRSPGQTEHLKKPKSLEEWMTQLEGPEAILVEDPGTTFIIPAGTTYASVSLSSSVYTSGLVISEHNLEFYRLSDHALLARSHPAAMAWISSLRDEGFLEMWETETRKWLNEVGESLNSPAFRKAFPDFRDMENDPAFSQSLANNISAVDVNAVEGSLPPTGNQNGISSTADDEVLTSEVDDAVMSPEGSDNDSLDLVARPGRNRKGMSISASRSSDSDTPGLQILSPTPSARRQKEGNESVRGKIVLSTPVKGDVTYRLSTLTYDGNSPKELTKDPELPKWITRANTGPNFDRGHHDRSLNIPGRKRPIHIPKQATVVLDDEQAKLPNILVDELALVLHDLRGTDGKCCVFTIEAFSYLNGHLRTSRSQWTMLSQQAFWEKERWIFPLLDTDGGNEDAHHYVLVVVHVKDRLMVVFDSLNFMSYQQRAVKRIAECVSSLVTLARRKGHPLDMESGRWTAQPLLDPRGPRPQSNNRDCGFWMLWVLLANLRGFDWAEMDEKDLPLFRQFVAHSIRNLPKV